MGRRKKRSQNDDSFDEELAIEIYKKRKSFERPENKGLETVFEGEAGKENETSENSPKAKVRAPRASKAKLEPKLRMISTQAYFIEDSDKSVHRKKQTAKLFKGRRKPKWKGLTAKQEEKLIQKIVEKTDTDIDTEEEEEEELRSSKNGAKVEKLPFIVNETLSTSSEGQINESLSFHTPPDSFHTPPSSLAKAKDDVIQEIEFDENTIKEADAFLGPLGFSDDEDDSSNQSTFKTLKVDKNEKETAVRKNDRRKSKITSVRRSSRLFRGQNSLPLTDVTDQSNNLGSVFQDVEVEEKSTKSRRRSSRPKVPEMNGQNSLLPLTDVTDQSNNLGSVFQDVEVEEKPTKSRRRSSRPKKLMCRKLTLLCT